MMKRNAILAAVTIGLAATVGMAQDHSHHHEARAAAKAADGLAVPSSLVEEHHHIHEQLAKAMAAGGKTGSAAQEVERVLSAHFKKEEEHAMKPLALLVPLAKGEKIDPALATNAIEATDELKRDYAQMLKEHQEIVAALDKLGTAAKEEKNDGALEFVSMLKLHALNEEQILYPAALLVGEQLKARH